MRSSTPMGHATRIAMLINSARINVTNEAMAQDGIHLALKPHFPNIRREVRLSPESRVDLMAAGVAVEVKVKTRQSRREILKQLERYAAHDEVDAVVLATAAPWPGTITDLKGKPLVIASLTKGWL